MTIRRSLRCFAALSSSFSLFVSHCCNHLQGSNTTSALTKFRGHLPGGVGWVRGDCPCGRVEVATSIYALLAPSTSSFFPPFMLFWQVMFWIRETFPQTLTHTRTMFPLPREAESSFETSRWVTCQEMLRNHPIYTCMAWRSLVSWGSWLSYLLSGLIWDWMEASPLQTAGHPEFLTIAPQEVVLVSAMPALLQKTVGQ